MTTWFLATIWAFSIHIGLLLLFDNILARERFKLFLHNPDNPVEKRHKSKAVLTVLFFCAVPGLRWIVIAIFAVIYGFIAFSDEETFMEMLEKSKKQGMSND